MKTDDPRQLREELRDHLCKVVENIEKAVALMNRHNEALPDEKPMAVDDSDELIDLCRQRQFAERQLAELDYQLATGDFREIPTE